MRVLNFAVYFLLIVTIISCTKDGIIEVVPTVTPEQPPNTITTPCDFDLLTITANSTVKINCLIDLKGETVTLPSGVTFEFEGGDIINGKLIFDGGTIDGRLLSSQLEIEGNVKLASTEFKFYAVRWGIIEGKIPQVIAYENHKNIQYAIDLIKRLKGNVFIINKLEAYFETGNGKITNTAALRIPSDFHLKMSNNTYLHVQPVNEAYSTRLIRIEADTNVVVTGGYLVGDRLEHGPTDGGNVLFVIKGGQNITVDNVNMSFSSSSGLTINSVLFPGDTRYIPSKDILVTNCIFDSNRANNLSITDGLDVVVDNCKLYRAGNDLEGKFGPSLGIAPRIGIVIEPVQGQFVDRVTLKNNVIEESRTNSILAAGGFNIIIAGTTADAPVGWTTATNVKVIDNPGLNGGIIGGLNLPYALRVSSNNIISGNTVRNAKTGIYATNDDIKIFDNQIINCDVGIMMRNLSASEIYKNTITSTVEGAFGINGQIAVNNVTLRDNVVKVLNGRSMNMVGVNQEAQYIDNKFYLKNNTIICSQSGVILNSRGFDITGNNFSTAGFGLTNSNNMLVSNNTITAQTGNVFGINKTVSTSNIIVTGNTFENTSSIRLGAYGIRLNTVGSNAIKENSTIIFTENNIKVLGKNYGMHVTGFDGVTISNNKIEHGENASIYYRGNNSTIRDNSAVISTGTYDIEGDNNVVENNK